MVKSEKFPAEFVGAGKNVFGLKVLSLVARIFNINLTVQKASRPTPAAPDASPRRDEAPEGS